MSIRLRLALWYTSLLAVMFLVFAPIVYLTLENELLLEVDRWLAPLGEKVMRSVDPGADPSKPLPSHGADLDAFAAPGVVVQILDPNGRVIGRSSNLQDRSIKVSDRAFGTAWWGTPASYTTSAEDSRYRGYLMPIPGDAEPRGFLLVARSLDAVDNALAGVRNFLIVGNLFGLVLALAVGWLIARSGLRPIEEITQTARAIALSQGFSQRLKVDMARDEVGQLAVTFNEMLASLDSAYGAQRRFVADASHELRSPLTSIRSNIDVLRRALDAPREDRAEALADVAAEVDRLSRMTSDLLLLARADAGHRIEMEEVALDGLVRQVHRQMAASANGVVLELSTVDPALVLGNSTWLKQLLLILVDNAFKYTPQGGTVRISLDLEDGDALLRVQDTGIGIAEADLDHVFERFYRADKARARDEGGAGLGLAIAQWIADEHGGDLSVDSEPGHGTTFSLRLPLLGGQSLG